MDWSFPPRPQSLQHEQSQLTSGNSCGEGQVHTEARLSRKEVGKASPGGGVEASRPSCSFFFLQSQGTSWTCAPAGKGFALSCVGIQDRDREAVPSAPSALLPHPASVLHLFSSFLFPKAGGALALLH